MPTWTLTRPDPIWVRTPKQVSKLKRKLANKLEAAIDTETTGLTIAGKEPDSVLFWSLSTGDDRYFFERGMLYEFEEVFHDKRRTWIGTHTKFDAHMLANCGIRLSGDWLCTLVMDRLLNPDNPHGLKEVYEREFEERMATFGETFYPRNVNDKPFKPKGEPLATTMMKAWDAVPDRVIDYASLDAWGSYRVYRRLRDYLKDETTWRGESLWDLYLDFEVPFTRILYNCERVGTQINAPYLESLKIPMQKEMDKVEKQLAKIAGTRVNPKSPKQLAVLFFEKLKLKPIKKGKSGAPSTDESVLNVFAALGIKEAQLVLRHRKIAKIQGTYVEGILNKLDKHNRLHGTLNQHVADTARLSSNEPNMQNMPRPDGDEFKIRKAFVARPGYKFVSADYDQLEMFLAAHWSNDKGMIQTILDGKDLHSGNAAMIWDESYDDIVAAKALDPEHDTLTTRHWQLREYRQFVKIIGFGLLYGKGPGLLAKELKIVAEVQAENPQWGEKKVFREAKTRAQAVIDKFFAGIPGVKQWINQTHRDTSEIKYVETLRGRRRWLMESMDWEERVAHQAEAEYRHKLACWCDDCRESRKADRQAVNTIVQGSAADVVQAAMINMHYDPDLSDSTMLFQVHDEVNLEVPDEIIEESTAKIKYDMEDPGYPDLRVPLKCTPGVGDNWVEAH